MATRDITPPLLAIPLELREQIFKEVLSSSSYGTELLRTCQEIRTEAHKYLFQRRITFRGQTALYAWLEQVPTKYLHHVTEITIELQEPDLSPLLAPVATSSSATDAPRLITVELHEKDLKKLRYSLEELPNVKYLTLRALSDRRSHLYREFVANFLKRLGSLWPDLQGLTLEGNFHNQSLSFLTTLSELRSFSFDGFSTSSPEELAAIFAQLEHLDSLSLVSQHGLLTPTRHSHSGFTSERQSLIGDVVREMSHLVSFSVTESIHPPSAPSSPALFFASEMLEALHGHKTLIHLTFRISQAPDTNTLEALDKLLAHSNIERLELDWPYLDPRVFEQHTLLPASLKELWVRVPSPEAAFDMLFVVQDGQQGEDTTELKKVVLVREMWDIPGEVEEAQVVEAELDDDVDEGYDDEEPATNDVSQCSAIPVHFLTSTQSQCLVMQLSALLCGRFQPQDS